jgi:ADP-ribose pyrophosphatase YjhB (NUDIX family)
VTGRSFPARPIVGVGAVVFDGDAVLLVRRGQAPLKGEWSLPGGAVELGELMRAAVVRELREETGIDVEVGPVVEVLDRVHLAADGLVEFHYVLIDFVCRPVTAVLSHGSDADDACWVRCSELAAYGVSLTTVAVIEKARALHASW